MKSLRDFEAHIFDRVNPAVKFSVTRYVLAIGIFVAVVVFGFVSMLGLGIDLLPAVNIPVVAVFTSFPGATPSVMDQQVTQPIENVVSSLSGITDISSTSSIGVSRVIISFDAGTDKTSDANQVSTLISATIRNLPSEIQTPTIRTFDPNSQPIVQFGVSGGGTSLTEVNDYVQNTLIPSLQLVSGVANVQTDGAPARQFQVLLNPLKLKYYNIVPQQVITAITSSAVNTPIGTINTSSNSLTFSTQNVPADITQIKRILVDASRGVSVDDLGTVRDVPADTDYARVDGKPLILVSVQRTTDSNAVAVVDGVRKLIAGTNLPAGYSVTFSNDTTGPIRATIDSTYHELFVTAIVVALIVLLFIGKLNTALSVILAIPIALSASPVLYKLAGFSFNLISLLALIIAIGIVVDDSIVVAENVERYRAMGFSLKDSVLKGASEVFSAVVAATLSLLSVLLPVSFIGGFIGAYIMQFSLGLAAAVAFSLLEAVLFLTVRLAYTPESKTMDWGDFLKSWILFPDALRWGLRSWRKGLGIVAGIAVAAGIFALTRKPVYVLGIVAYPLALAAGYYVLRIALSFLQALTTTLHGITERGLELVRDAYSRSLKWVMSGSVAVLLGAAAFLVVSVVVIMPKLPFNFVPQSDSGVLYATLRFPAGTPPIVANRDTSIVESYLMQRPEVRTVQAVVGHFGQTISQLTPVGTRPNIYKLIPVYRRQLAALFKDQPSVRVAVSAGGFQGGFGPSMQLNITAANFDTLIKRNNAVIQTIQANPFVADVTSSLSDVSLENDFIPDDSLLKGTGITPNQIAQALETYTSGTQASNVVTGGLSYPIQVESDPTAISGGQSLLNLPIYSPTLQTMLSIGQLGKFQLTQAPLSISRDNRQYTGELSIDLNPDAPPSLTMQTQLTEELAKAGLLGGGVGLIAGSRFSQAALASELSTSGPLIFLLAFFLAYLVMAAQFNSWRYPIYLLMPVPLALVGALWFVFVIGGGLDIFGLLGLLMLIGLSAKNAILYLDFVVERIGKMPFRDALREAAELRFRPIVMTTLTVLVISFPLIFGKGQGSEFGQRMGLVMFGGIVFSAVLTFFVVPAAFYLFERSRVEKAAGPSTTRVSGPESAAKRKTRDAGASETMGKPPRRGKNTRRNNRRRPPEEGPTEVS